MKKHEIDRHRNMSVQLGMPRGTAANRLRKLVLFDVLKRHDENVCYRCELEIESADKLSIEHKEPWENVDVSLFWDLSNVAFSHLSCNCAAARRPQTGKPDIKRITPPQGAARCRSHKKFLPAEKFSKNASNWNGLRRDCKEHEKEYKDRIRGKVSEDSADGLQTVSNTVPS
ncbi:Uncharacterised protein [uncultured archaeon]|nr:Uncharacterised protein [uncultured archaeon]